MDIYVGNLPYSMTEAALSELFSAHGNVSSVKIVIDRDTGRSKGFGFVTMSNPTEAAAAIEALDGTESDGRALRINEARPKADRSDRPPRR
jgi:RNA recognition motif-containing protein